MSIRFDYVPDFRFAEKDSIFFDNFDIGHKYFKCLCEWLILYALDLFLKLVVKGGGSSIFFLDGGMCTYSIFYFFCLFLTDFSVALFSGW